MSVSADNLGALLADRPFDQLTLVALGPEPAGVNSAMDYASAEER